MFLSQCKDSKVRKMMAGMGKQATGGDLHRVAEMEESLKNWRRKCERRVSMNRK